MRWGEEVKSMKGLDLPSSKAKNMAPSAAELKMAKMLVEDMSGPWDPEDFQDEFRQTIMGLVEKKARAGKTETVIEPQEESPAYTDNVIDLTELLQRSLKGKKGGESARKTAAKSSKKAAPRKRAAKKTAGKTARKATRSGSGARKAA